MPDLQSVCCVVLVSYIIVHWVMWLQVSIEARIMTNDGVGPICPNGGISSGQMTALSPANTFVNRLRPRPSHTMRAPTGTIKNWDSGIMIGGESGVMETNWYLIRHYHDVSTKHIHKIEKSAVLSQKCFNFLRLKCWEWINVTNVLV